MKHFPAFFLGSLSLATCAGALAEDAAPTITSPGQITVLVGQPFSYQITATGNPTSFGPFYVEDDLTYDPAKGLISGVPTNPDYLYEQISATNDSGTGTRYLSLAIEYDLAATPLSRLEESLPTLINGTLTLGTDGNFYGVHGRGDGGNTAVIRMTPQGQTTECLELADFNSFLATDLVADAAGNFYSTLTENMTATPPIQIVRLTTSGQMTTLYRLTDLGDGIPHSALCLARDGNLYGELDHGVGSTGGALFRLTPAGVFTILHRFNDATEGSTPSALVEGPDGNLYGTTTTAGGPAGGGTLFMMTPGGAFTVLKSFASNATSGGPCGPLTVGSDGNLYGTTRYAHQGYADTTTLAPQSSIYRVTPGGAVTTLRTRNNASEGRYPTCLVRGADGFLYGFGTYGSGGFLSDLERYAPDGSSTYVHRFGFFDNSLADKPTVGVDGNLYCLAGGGRFGQYGSFVRITPGLNQNNHPAFFKGEVSLANGVFFLPRVPLSTGGAFGYYAYLSDPHFIYHFDLGYEYWFDAADGRDGIYFYDFKSSSFFYTSQTFPFPYLYDFGLNTVLYYYPDPKNPGHYNTDGTRYFYNFATGQIITK